MIEGVVVGFVVVFGLEHGDDGDVMEGVVFVVAAAVVEGLGNGMEHDDSMDQDVPFL